MSGTVHILCAVRDWRDLRPLIAQLDDGEHCIFEIVTSGPRAIEACLKAPPDILLVEAVLPGMDGLGVVDCLKHALGERMPRVIAGAGSSFSENGFRRRGVRVVAPIPWETDILKQAILREMSEMEECTDWNALAPLQQQACALLEQMGMHASLKGYIYLSHAAALAYENESRLFHVGREIYGPIAGYFGTTCGNVERLIRHAVESTMTAARARGVYSLFGNTIDPAKGKPTNAQVIALLVQRLRVERGKTVEVDKIKDRIL